MNTNLLPPNSHAMEKTRSDRALAMRDEEWQLRDECVALARQAIAHYKSKGEKKLNIPDIGRLLDLAAKLGRLATGSSMDYAEPAWSQYHDPVFIAHIDREIEKIFGKPIDVQSDTHIQSTAPAAGRAHTSETNLGANVAEPSDDTATPNPNA